MSETGTSLTVLERAAVALGASEREKALAELARQSAAIVAITNNAGAQECHAARMRLKSQRIEIQKIGKDARDDATKFAKAVIQEEQRLIAIIDPEERRLEVIEDNWEAKKQHERAAREQAERERLARIQAAIEAIKGVLIDVTGKPSAVIAEALAKTQAEPIDETYGEFADVAEQAKVATVKKLTELHAAAIAQEQEAERQRVEAERLKAECEELKRLRAEQEARQREEDARMKAAMEARLEQDRIAREKLEAEERASRERIEAQEREARRQREEADRQAREAREAEEARLKAERDRIEEAARKLREEEEAKAAAARREQEEIERKARAEAEAARTAAEAKARAEREAEEERQREIRRQEAETLDFHGALESILVRFGHRQDAAPVFKAINAYLKKHVRETANAE